MVATPSPINQSVKRPTKTSLITFPPINIKFSQRTSIKISKLDFRNSDGRARQVILSPTRQLCRLNASLSRLGGFQLPYARILAGFFYSPDFGETEGQVPMFARLRRNAQPLVSPKGESTHDYYQNISEKVHGRPNYFVYGSIPCLIHW